jgi:hypothetical protein
MRDARYMRLISWTLQSGSKQFIYNWNQTNADLDHGTGNKECTRQQRKQTNGNTSRVKSYTQTVKTRKILTTEKSGWEYKSCQKLHPNCQDKEILTTE